MHAQFAIRTPVRKQELTLSDYIRRRNGVPAGARGGLRHMLYRSLGAGSFAGFWRTLEPSVRIPIGKIHLCAAQTHDAACARVDRYLFDLRRHPRSGHNGSTWLRGCFFHALVFVPRYRAANRARSAHEVVQPALARPRCGKPDIYRYLSGRRRHPQASLHFVGIRPNQTMELTGASVRATFSMGRTISLRTAVALCPSSSSSSR